MAKQLSLLVHVDSASLSVSIVEVFLFEARTDGYMSVGEWWRLLLAALMGSSRQLSCKTGNI